VMAQHIPFYQRAFGERRQLTVPHERRKAHDRVVAPIWSAIALPPGAADGVGAHAQPHAELENAGKGAGRWHSNDQRLQDPKAGSDLHDPLELEDEVRRHEAVGIEQYCEIVMLAPARAEVSDISGFETDIVGATAVCQSDPAAP